MVILCSQMALLLDIVFGLYKAPLNVVLIKYFLHSDRASEITV